LFEYLEAHEWLSLNVGSVSYPAEGN